MIPLLLLLLLLLQGSRAFSAAPLLVKSSSSLAPLAAAVRSRPSSALFFAPNHGGVSQPHQQHQRPQPLPLPTALPAGWGRGSSSRVSARHDGTSTRLYMSEIGGGKIGKVVISTLVLLVFVGFSVAPLFKALGGNDGASQSTVKVIDEDGNISERGVYTSMTTYEINRKLSQLPVFFAKTPAGEILMNEGTGTFFMSPVDAKNDLDRMAEAGVSGAKDAKVAATSLDDVYFPLIAKKVRKNKVVPNVGAGIAVKADRTANYRLVPEAGQVAKAKEFESWTGGDNGVPFFMAERLAFGSNKQASKMQIPMFASYADMETTWKRLDSEKPPTVSVGTIGEAVGRMQIGGVESRMLEFFADVNAVEQAEQLYTSQ